jgi:hypothetical protein
MNRIAQATELFLRDKMKPAHKSFLFREKELFESEMVGNNTALDHLVIQALKKQEVQSCLWKEKQ